MILTGIILCYLYMWVCIAIVRLLTYFLRREFRKSRYRRPQVPPTSQTATTKTNEEESIYTTGPNVKETTISLQTTTIILSEIMPQLLKTKHPMPLLHCMQSEDATPTNAEDVNTTPIYKEAKESSPPEKLQKMPHLHSIGQMRLLPLLVHQDRQ